MIIGNNPVAHGTGLSVCGSSRRNNGIAGVVGVVVVIVVCASPRSRCGFHA